MSFKPKEREKNECVFLKFVNDFLSPLQSPKAKGNLKILCLWYFHNKT